VADWNYGLRIINISNPSSPFEVGFYDTPGLAHGVAISSNYAYVADGSSGLRIINVSNPSLPFEVGFCGTADSVYNVAVSGDFAYLANFGAGLRIINVSNPSSPQLVGYYNTPGTAYGVAVVGNLVYVAAGQEFGIYDCTAAVPVIERGSSTVPATFALLLNYPNPFNAETEIRYTLPKAELVSLKVFEVQGREVRTLVNFKQNAGTYSVRFDAGSLPSGVYFARLRAGSYTASQKLVLLR